MVTTPPLVTVVTPGPDQNSDRPLISSEARIQEVADETVDMGNFTMLAEDIDATARFIGPTNLDSLQDNGSLSGVVEKLTSMLEDRLADEQRDPEAHGSLNDRLKERETIMNALGRLPDLIQRFTNPKPTMSSGSLGQDPIPSNSGTDDTVIGDAFEQALSESLARLFNLVDKEDGALQSDQICEDFAVLLQAPSKTAQLSCLKPVGHPARAKVPIEKLLGEAKNLRQIEHQFTSAVRLALNKPGREPGIIPSILLVLIYRQVNGSVLNRTASSWTATPGTMNMSWIQAP